MLGLYNILMSVVYNGSRLLYGSKLKAGEKFWQGRFGQIVDLQPANIWLHAASVGEIKVIGHLIRKMQKEKPTIKIHITAMTRTGYETANKLYPSCQLSFFPFDHKQAIRRTLDILQPQLLLVAETEIWPNLILEASKRNIPIALINGRMSEKAFGRYRLIDSVMSKLLTQYSRLFVKTEADAKRFKSFESSQSIHIEVAGDMKFDAPVIELSWEDKVATRNRFYFAETDKLLVCGSTRPGEEQQLIDIFKQVQKDNQEFKLVLAPRHLDRLDEIGRLLDESGINWRNHDTMNKQAGIVLVTQMGLLEQLYSIAEIAFVGGTLVDIGGHNLLEPVWRGTPVLFGSSIFNVQEQADYLVKHKYGAMAKNKDELLNFLIKFLAEDILFTMKTSSDIHDTATAKISRFVYETITHG